MKKGKGSVSGFTDEQGVTHVPGDVVDIPASYLGQAWLEPVEEEKKVKAAPSVVEAPAEAAAVPLEARPQKKNRRMPRIFRR